MENIFDEIDACENIDELNNIRTRYSDTYYVNIFWNSRKKALRATTSLEKKKALTKCRYINHIYASYIPVTYGCQRFRSPHGFRGIAISSRAKIGKGCTIFQNVTIGSNTLADSKSSGFPVIGDNVYIGAGATIIGDVKIGNNMRIGAGCCVTRDVEDNCTVAQGKPIVIQKHHIQDNTFLTPSQYLKKRAQITDVSLGGMVLNGADER
ncbi:serine acetyltransferase [Selenomonas sp. KH1T6]|uniref:serine acetyltransferase n=1 Tax=Selenomonas sp. KH1T6 TaxID=3158784 RepID=UPI0008A729F8|nr:serine O-acetyltransferase [Selenomonas ruminantium]